MQEVMIHQTVVTPQLATAASMLVRMAHPQDASLARALEKAQERLITLPWSVDGGVLCISSHSTPGQVHFCDGDTCDCLTTRGVCWHKGAWHLVCTLAATGIIPVASLPLLSPAAMRQIEDGDFPGDFLDTIDELAYDDYGDLVPPARTTFREPYRPRIVEVVPPAGSQFARAQELADRMFA